MLEMLNHSLSVLDTPTNYSQAAEQTNFKAQILLSWPFRPGFMDRDEPAEVPATTEDRLKFIKELSASWTEPFRSLIQNLSDEVEMKPVKLEDWLPQTQGVGLGKLALLGDSGHSMTMCTFSSCSFACWQRS
jgi:hypothetical protein